MPLTCKLPPAPDAKESATATLPSAFRSGSANTRAAKARDKTAKPFEIMKTMRNEIAQEAAAALAARLPAVEVQTRGPAFEVPGHDHVLEAPDRATVQNRLSALP